MKRLNYLFSLGMISLMTFGFVSCDDDDDDDDTAMEIMVSQDDLNNVTTMVGEYTGNDIQDFGHPGDSGDATIRVVYANFSPISKTAEPGDIIAKRTYAKTESGEKGEILSSYAMVKREAGYNPDAAD